MYVIAVDVGYGNIKRAVGRADEIPRIDVWPACAIPVADAGIDLFDKAKPADVIVAGTPWYVGLDPEDNAEGFQTLHRDYVGSPAWLAQLHYALTRLPAPESRLGAASRAEHPIDRLILGLPVEDWQDRHARDHLVGIAYKALADTGYAAAQSVIQPMPQPLGAYVSANLNAEGSLTEHNTLVVDPGYNTLDWTLFSRGKLKREGTGTTRHGGVARIVESVRRRLHETDGANVSEGRIRDALNRIDTGGEILVWGEKRDCSEMMKAARDDVVSRALTNLKRSLQINAEGIDDVVLTGGGASLYRDAITKMFPRTHLHQSENTVSANVFGFWYFGAHRG